MPIFPPTGLCGQQNLQALPAKPLNLAGIDENIRAAPRQKGRRQGPGRLQIKNRRALQQRINFSSRCCIG